MVWSAMSFEVCIWLKLVSVGCIAIGVSWGFDAFLGWSLDMDMLETILDVDDCMFTSNVCCQERILR